MKYNFTVTPVEKQVAFITWGGLAVALFTGTAGCSMGVFSGLLRP